MRTRTAADLATSQKALLVFAYRLWDDSETKAEKDSQPKKVLHWQHLVFICQWSQTEAAALLRRHRVSSVHNFLVHKRQKVTLGWRLQENSTTSNLLGDKQRGLLLHLKTKACARTNWKRSNLQVENCQGCKWACRSNVRAVLWLAEEGRVEAGPDSDLFRAWGQGGQNQLGKAQAVQQIRRWKVD